jgi:bacillaene synthase trans-acting acyltransferase
MLFFGGCVDHDLGNLPIVFLFVGQGSQYFRMGSELFHTHRIFREWMHTGDRLVRDRFGFSVIDAIQGQGRLLSDPFDRLSATHPAIFLTEYALAQVLQHHGIFPDSVLGVSLGETVAMTVADMLSFEPALLSVAQQPDIFIQTCSPGRMVTVLADPALHAGNPVLATHSELVGTGAARHCVLAAPATALPVIGMELERLFLPHQTLPVPFAFHSRWIEPSEPAYRAATAALHLRKPRWPVFSTALQRRSGPYGFDLPPDELLWQIVRRPMRIGEMLLGIEAAGGAIYVDLSPSGTLAGFARRAMEAGSPSRVFPLLNPFGEDLCCIARLLDAIRPAGYPALQTALVAEPSPAA